MEKKVYLIYRSSRGAKDFMCVTETEENARKWIKSAYKAYADCKYTFHFRAFPVVVDNWYDGLPKAL